METFVSRAGEIMEWTKTTKLIDYRDMFNVTRDDAMSSFQTPLGPVVFNAPARRCAARPDRRGRGRRLLDVALISLAFGFIALMVLGGPQAEPPPVTTGALVGR